MPLWCFLELNSMEEKEYGSAGRMMYLIAWIMAFFLLFVFFYYYKNATVPEYTLKNGMLAIPADSQGHFRLQGLINGQKVIFIVDTGATLVAIPKSKADSMKLEELYPLTMKTAGGESEGFLTRLEALSFGDFKLDNVKAVIVPGMRDDEEILLGMNVLSHFVLLQENNQLIIRPRAGQ